LVLLPGGGFGSRGSGPGGRRPGALRPGLDGPARPVRRCAFRAGMPAGDDPSPLRSHPHGGWLPPGASGPARPGLREPLSGPGRRPPGGAARSPDFEGGVGGLERRPAGLDRGAGGAPGHPGAPGRDHSGPALAGLPRGDLPGRTLRRVGPPHAPRRRGGAGAPARAGLSGAPAGRGQQRRPPCPPAGLCPVRCPDLRAPGDHRGGPSSPAARQRPGLPVRQGRARSAHPLPRGPGAHGGGGGSLPGRVAGRRGGPPHGAAPRGPLCEGIPARIVRAEPAATLHPRRAVDGSPPTGARTRGGGRSGLGGVLPGGPRGGGVRPQSGHPLRRSGLGGQFDPGLASGDHRRGSPGPEPALRALPAPGAQGHARHRRGLRFRSPPRGDRLDGGAFRSSAHRHDRHGLHLWPEERRPGHAQGPGLHSRGGRPGGGSDQPLGHAGQPAGSARGTPGGTPGGRPAAAVRAGPSREGVGGKASSGPAARASSAQAARPLRRPLRLAGEVAGVPSAPGPAQRGDGPLPAPFDLFQPFADLGLRRSTVAVRQGRRRGSGPGQVRCPGAADAFGPVRGGGPGPGGFRPGAGSGGSPPGRRADL